LTLNVEVVFRSQFGRQPFRPGDHPDVSLGSVDLAIAGAEEGREATAVGGSDELVGRACDDDAGYALQADRFEL